MKQLTSQIKGLSIKICDCVLELFVVEPQHRDLYSVKQADRIRR